MAKKTVKKANNNLKELSKWSALAVLALITLVAVLLTSQISNTAQLQTTQTSASEYRPRIRPSDFTTNITNKYFNLPIGKKMVYELETEEGLEKIEIQIIGKKKRLMGVETITYWDRVWIDTNGDKKFSKKELVEETYDYLAQDKSGNVWYFGEDVDNYENGVLIDHDGSWLAGKDGALPGIWIKGKHKEGDEYRQEYLAGEAEDMRKVVATDVTVETDLGTFRDCVQMFDWTPLDPTALEYKYYCAQVGALVKSEHLDEDMQPTDVTEIKSITGGKQVDDEDDTDNDDDRD